jgi:acyl carrier protein
MMLREFARVGVLPTRRIAAPAEENGQVERAVIDSLRLAEAIRFIEGEFGVYVSDDEITETNFGSLRSIARLVASKQPFAVG